MSNAQNQADTGSVDRSGDQTALYSWDGETDFDLFLLESLDAATDGEVTDAHPIHEQVDVEGVVDFITNSESDHVYAIFSYGEYYIEVKGDGRVTVSPFRSIN